MFGRYCCALKYTFESSLQNDPDLTQPRGLFVEGIIKDKCGRETLMHSSHVIKLSAFWEMLLCSLVGTYQVPTFWRNLPAKLHVTSR